MTKPTREMNRLSSSSTTATVAAKQSNEVTEVSDNRPPKKNKLNVEASMAELLSVCHETSKTMEDITGRLLLLEDDGYDCHRLHSQADEQSEYDSLSHIGTTCPCYTTSLDTLIVWATSPWTMLLMVRSMKITPTADLRRYWLVTHELEATGPPVDEKLAKGIDLVFATGMSSREFEAATSKFLRPKNG